MSCQVRPVERWFAFYKSLFVDLFVAMVQFAKHNYSFGFAHQSQRLYRSHTPSIAVQKAIFPSKYAHFFVRNRTGAFSSELAFQLFSAFLMVFKAKLLGTFVGK